MLQHIPQQEYSAPEATMGSQGKNISQLVKARGMRKKPVPKDSKEDLETLRNKYKQDQAVKVGTSRLERSIANVAAKDILSFDQASREIVKQEATYMSSKKEAASGLNSSAEKFSDVAELRKVTAADQTGKRYTIDTRAQLKAWWNQMMEKKEAPKLTRGKGMAQYNAELEDYKGKTHYYEKANRVKRIRNLKNTLIAQDKSAEIFNAENTLHNQLLLGGYQQQFGAQQSTEDLLALRDASKTDLGGLLKKNKTRPLQFETADDKKTQRANREAAAQEKAIQQINTQTLVKISNHNSITPEDQELVEDVLGRIPYKKEPTPAAKDPVKEAARRLAITYIYGEEPASLQVLTAFEVGLIVKYLLKGASERDKWYAVLLVNDYKDMLPNILEGALKPKEYLEAMKGGVVHPKLKEELEKEKLNDGLKAGYKAKIAALREVRDKAKYDTDGKFLRFGMDYYRQAFEEEERLAGKAGLTSDWWKSPDYQMYETLRKNFHEGMVDAKLRYLPNGFDGSSKVNKRNDYILKVIEDIAFRQKQKKEDASGSRLRKDALWNWDTWKKRPYRTNFEIFLSQLLRGKEEELLPILTLYSAGQREARANMDNPPSAFMKAVESIGSARLEPAALFLFNPALKYLENQFGDWFQSAAVWGPVTGGAVAWQILEIINNGKHPLNSLQLANAPLAGREIPILKGGGNPYLTSRGRVNNSWKAGLKTNGKLLNDQNKARFQAANENF
ncbi:MAG: hypothetical protein AAFQ98_24825, partial [Bacteroidota bacterium]